MNMEGESKNFKIETAYNRLLVHQHGERFELRSLDNAMQSLVDLRHPGRLLLKNLECLMGVLLFIAAPTRVLLLGTAGGSLLHYLRQRLPRARIDAVDIDAELIEKMLGLGILPPAGNGLSYIYDDAANYISACGQTYDLVLIDIFSGAQSPRWLQHKSSGENLYRLLSADGALAYNLLIDSEHDFRQFYRDLRLVFNDKTLCLPVQGFENTIAYAFRSAPPARDLGANLQHASEASAMLGIDAVKIMSVIYNTNPIGGGVL